jgi:16S rRNA processing protein RimM
VIVLGRIAAPYGVHGWVKLHAFGDDPEAWCGIKDWWLGAQAEGLDWQRRELKELKAHGKGWVARFAGVDDRSGAERLEGLYFAAPRAELPQTAPDEYYWGDLVGLKVENLAGDLLGSVKEMIESGANAVLVVAGPEDGAERLLPFVAGVVKEVDLGGGRIRVEWGKDW